MITATNYTRFRKFTATNHKSGTKLYIFKIKTFVIILKDMNNKNFWYQSKLSATIYFALTF